MGAMSTVMSSVISLGVFLHAVSHSIIPGTYDPMILWQAGGLIPLFWQLLVEDLHLLLIVQLLACAGQCELGIFLATLAIFPFTCDFGKC